MSSSVKALPEVGFYYPNPIWADSNAIKNLILFFDEIALLVPEYMRDKPFRIDPATTAGLNEHGLLRILEPETFIDQSATEALATAMTDVITSGALDTLATTHTKFHELSYSRLGFMADSGLAEMIYEELKVRGLARASEDGVSIPMHPVVRSLILVLLAQLLIPTGKTKGLDLHPVTDRPDVHQSLMELLGLPNFASAGRVVALDLANVGVDLSSVPIGEILGFRGTYREKYRTYSRDLRRFVREIGNLSGDDQQHALDERAEEISDSAHALRSAASKAWRKRGSFALGLAGAAWRVKSGDAVGALLAIGGATLIADLTGPVEAGAYSYLFAAKRRLG